MFLFFCDNLFIRQIAKIRCLRPLESSARGAAEIVQGLWRSWFAVEPIFDRLAFCYTYFI